MTRMARGGIFVCLTTLSSIEKLHVLSTIFFFLQFDYSKLLNQVFFSKNVKYTPIKKILHACIYDFIVRKFGVFWGISPIYMLKEI